MSSTSSSWTLERRVWAFVSTRLVCASVVSGSFIELAVKRRAADFQPPRDFGHLPAIMRNREPDDLGLHLFERPHFSGARQHRQGPGRRQRDDRYFVTGNHSRRGRMKRRLKNERFDVLAARF